jgi:ABC-type transport system substrate-binding protein
MMARSLQFSDPQHANELWARVDRRLTRAAAWAPLVNSKGVELVSKRLGNYSFSPVTGMILSQVWVN